MNSAPKPCQESAGWQKLCVTVNKRMWKNVYSISFDDGELGIGCFSPHADENGLYPVSISYKGHHFNCFMKADESDEQNPTLA